MKKILVQIIHNKLSRGKKNTNEGFSSSKIVRIFSSSSIKKIYITLLQLVSQVSKTLKKPETKIVKKKTPKNKSQLQNPKIYTKWIN